MTAQGSTSQVSSGGPRAIRQMWAVALNTFGEALRRKIFVVLVVFAAIILCLAPLLPTDGTVQGRIRLIISICSMATSVICTLVVLLIGASSLADEIESKRIFSTSTKPVRRSVYLCGKYLGVMLVAALLAGVMALGTAAFVRVVAWRSGGAGGVLTARAERMPVAVGESALTAGASETHDGPEARKVEIVPAGQPLPYRFSMRDVPRGGDKVVLRMKAFSGMSAQTQLAVEGRDPISGAWYGTDRVIISGMTEEISLPASIIARDGSLTVRVVNRNAGGRPIEMRRSDGLVLAVAAGPFEWNLFKWTVLLYWRLALIGAVVVGGSAFLSFPVAALAGLGVWLGGYLRSFALEVISSGRAFLSHTGDGGDAEQAMTSVISMICRILPDLSGMGASSALADSQAIGLGMILSAFLWLVLVRGGIFAAVGLTAFGHRELGA